MHLSVWRWIYHLTQINIFWESYTATEELSSITASSDRIKTGNTKCGWHSCAPATACVSLTMAMSVMGSNKNSFCQAWLEMTPHIPHLPTLPSLKALTQSLDTQVQEKRCAYVFFSFLLSVSSGILWLLCSHSIASLFTLASTVQPHASLPLTDMKCKHRFFFSSLLNE